MDYLQDFLNYVRFVHGRADNTVQSYRWDLTSFLDWAKLVNLDVTKAKPTDIDDFFIWLRREKENVAQTVNRKRSSLRMFYKWLLRKELISKNPMEQVERMKEPKTLPNYLSPQQQEALINASLDGNGAKRIGAYSRERTHLLILLLLDCGLRIGEACSLRVEDINFEDRTLKVKGKGSKERIAVLSDRLLLALKEYLNRVNEIDIERKIRPGIPARGLNLAKIAEETGIPFNTVIELTVARRPENIRGKRERELQSFIDEKVKPLPLQYVLFNRGGKSLNTRQAFRIIREIGRKAGVEIHPHLLRHSFAVNLRRKGADTMLLKEALGHSSILTTQIYCAFTDGEFKERMRQLVN
jgi:site-specific recombinase XerD